MTGKQANHSRLSRAEVCKIKGCPGHQPFHNLKSLRYMNKHWHVAIIVSGQDLRCIAQVDINETHIDLITSSNKRLNLLNSNEPNPRPTDSTPSCGFIQASSTGRAQKAAAAQRARESPPSPVGPSHEFQVPLGLEQWAKEGWIVYTWHECTMWAPQTF